MNVVSSSFDSNPHFHITQLHRFVFELILFYLRRLFRLKNVFWFVFRCFLLVPPPIINKSNWWTHLSGQAGHFVSAMQENLLINIALKPADQNYKVRIETPSSGKSFAERRSQGGSRSWRKMLRSFRNILKQILIPLGFHWSFSMIVVRSYPYI